MDIQIKGEIDGIQTADQIAQLVDVPIIFLTANSDQITIDRAKNSGPLAYLLKPFEDRGTSLTYRNRSRTAKIATSASSRSTNSGYQ